MSGADTNAGLNETQPWKSLNKIDSTTFGPGDRILLEYTAQSWSAFAKALTRVTRVAGDASAAKPQVAAAITALVSAVGEPHSVAVGTFQTITNKPFLNDTSGNPIYSQGMAWVTVRRLGAPNADDAPRLQRTPCW